MSLIAALRASISFLSTNIESETDDTIVQQLRVSQKANLKAVWSQLARYTVPIADCTECIQLLNETTIFEDADRTELRSHLQQLTMTTQATVILAQGGQTRMTTQSFKFIHNYLTSNDWNDVRQSGPRIESAFTVIAHRSVECGCTHPDEGSRIAAVATVAVATNNLFTPTVAYKLQSAYKQIIEHTRKGSVRQTCRTFPEDVNSFIAGFPGVFPQGEPQPCPVDANKIEQLTDYYPKRSTSKLLTMHHQQPHMFPHTQMGALPLHDTAGDELSRLLPGFTLTPTRQPQSRPSPLALTDGRRSIGSSDCASVHSDSPHDHMVTVPDVHVEHPGDTLASAATDTPAMDIVDHLLAATGAAKVTTVAKAHAVAKKAAAKSKAIESAAASAIATAKPKPKGRPKATPKPKGSPKSITSAPSSATASSSGLTAAAAARAAKTAAAKAKALATPGSLGCPKCRYSESGCAVCIARKKKKGTTVKCKKVCMKAKKGKK
jgi:hypothetical protein